MNIVIAAIIIVTMIASLMGWAGVIAWWIQSKGGWRKDPYGRWAMLFLVSGSILAGTSATTHVLGPWPGSQYLILVAWIGLCMALAWPLLLWRKSYREARGNGTK